MDKIVQRGRFITLEGPEGAGKTTQVEALRERVETEGFETVVTREPGGTAVAERIREILLDPSLPALTPEAETLLMFAARAEHITRVISPALASGKWVICDRFTDATYAYQGGGRGVDDHWIETLEQLVQAKLRPDLVVVFDLPVELGLARAKRRAPSDRFERETIDFFERVREKYITRSRLSPQTHVIVDATLPVENLRVAVLKAVERLL